MNRTEAINCGEQLTEVTERDRAMARGLARVEWLEQHIGCLYVAVLAAVAMLFAMPAIVALLRGTRP